MLSTFSRPYQRLLLTALFLAGCVLVLVNRANPRLQSQIQEAIGPYIPYGTTKGPIPEAYNWTTHSEFGILPRSVDASTASISQLCAYFPKHLLHDIQPVLKTGHNVLDARLAFQLKSVSACFGSDLLIFSDKDEVYQGQSLVDAIAEVPAVVRSQTPEQFIGYDALTNSSIKATPKDGWNVDKFKFLTSISMAWRMRPNRRWYVFYEGDTYVVWDNVFRFLQNFDPDQSWYFGSPSPGAMDEKIRVWFANGGPGYILSREAMRKAVEGDWDRQSGEYLGPKLNERHWERLLGDCCGDSVLGWALWKEKVTLQGIWPMFNPHSPHSVPFGKNYWCEPIMTMHKPHSDSMEDMWRWQFKVRQLSQPLLYRDLAANYYNFTTLTTEENWDNADYDSFDPSDARAHKSVKDCREVCATDGACFQWTFRTPDKCTFVRAFRMGARKSPESETTDQGVTVTHKFTAGWMTDKIKRYIAENECKEPKWVTPSLTRIY